MNDGLTSSEREAICSVLAQFPAVQKAVLFGSRAMGTFSPASDIDLALYGASLTLSDESRIASRIEDLGLPFLVDLVRYHTITSQALLEHILQHGKLFYAATSADEIVGFGSLGMAGEWHLTTFEEAPLQIIDGDRGKNYPNQAEFSSTGHCLFLNAGNVTTNGFRFADCAFITARRCGS